MIINFLGDSITQGAGASNLDNCYVSVVGKLLNCTANNYGVGGTRIARQVDKSNNLEPVYDLDFQLRAPDMCDADLVFVFGGTNDWGHGDAPIGTPTDTNPCTYYGGINNLIAMLTAKYGKDKLHFIIPLHRFGDENPLGEGNKKTPSLTLKGYVDILKSVLDANGIPYLDLFYNGLPTPTTNATTEYFADGVHPTDKGHAYIAHRIAEYVQSLK